jgi:hypothetical protein
MNSAIMLLAPKALTIAKANEIDPSTQTFHDIGLLSSQMALSRIHC